MANTTEYLSYPGWKVHETFDAAADAAREASRHGVHRMIGATVRMGGKDAQAEGRRILSTCSMTRTVAVARFVDGEDVSNA